MRKKERYEKILAWFRENVPVAETELHYDNPFETSLLPKHSPLLLPTWYTSISAASPIPTTKLNIL